jgi:hypothetical protein
MRNTAAAKRARIASKANAQAARARAERLRPIFEQLQHFSSEEIARKLNARRIRTAKGNKWYAATVINTRNRLGLHSTKRKKMDQSRIRIRLPLNLHKRVMTECARRGVLMADAIRELLEREFPRSPHVSIEAHR